MPRVQRARARPASARRPDVGTVVAAAVLLAGLAGGCAIVDRLRGEAPMNAHAVALHMLAQPELMTGTASRLVTNPDGSRRICVRRLPLIANRHVRAGRLEETGNPERPAIRLLLDHQGSMLWMQICHEAPGDSLAVLLDGFYWFTMTIPRPLDTQSILLEGPIGRTEATAIVDSLAKQYRKLSPNPNLF